VSLYSIFKIFFNTCHLSKNENTGGIQPLAVITAPEKRRFLAMFKMLISRLMVVSQTLGTHGKGRSKRKTFSR
jgi:hypothetical protein